VASIVDRFAGNRSIVAAVILSAACIVLLLTAPVNGDFWWSDAPRHALNGVFVKDFIAAHPIHRPVQWAIDYYLRRPALTIMFYPPLFYAAEAIAFALFGVSHFVAQATVSMFVLLLGASAYLLARMFLPRWSALGAALLVIGTPEAAFWGRQVMLDVPAYALVVTSAVCLAVYLRDGRPLAIYLTALFLLAAIYTKYNAAFIAPAFAIACLIAKGKGVLRDRHALIAAALAVAGLLPAVAILLKFGAQNFTSVSGLQGNLPLDSLACWLFYLMALPAQLGWLTVLLGASGLVLVAKRIVGGQDCWTYTLLLAWLAVGYLFFTLISLKEPRDTTMVLLPLAIGAPLFLLAIVPKQLGEPAGLALGVGTVLYTLIFCPVPRVGGYQEIVSTLRRTYPGMAWCFIPAIVMRT
jgi:4-amino-4-deoxy-L-arabinose transferase-like glycosyltransferase